MKKIILLSLCIITISLYSKTYGREPFKGKHEFSIRWGAIYDIYESHDDYLWWFSPLDRYNSGKYYHGDKVSTEAITISYAREMKRWLTISINASYFGVYQKEREISTDKVTDKYSKHRISLYPMLRFTYLNRPMIRLYSSVGLGLGVTKEGWSYNDRYDQFTEFSGQLTFFGVSVGKKLFVSWEVGIGDMGYLTMGGGYRF